MWAVEPHRDRPGDPLQRSQRRRRRTDLRRHHRSVPLGSGGTVSPPPNPPSTLDQATRDLLVAYATAGRPPIHLSTPADARAAGARAWAPSGSGPAMREV